MTRTKYPWIGYKNLQKPEEGRIDVIDGLYTLGRNYAMSRASGYISKLLGKVKEPESRIGKAFLTTITKYFGAKKQSIGQKFETDLNHIFPAIGLLHDLTEGSTDGIEFYCAEFEGKESTIYIRTKTQKEPTDDQLIANVKQLKENRHSPYQGIQEGGGFFRSAFSKPGVDYITNDDFQNLLEDQVHAKAWFSRDEMYFAQQHGEQLKFSDGGAEKTLEGLKVRKYSKPNRWESLKCWGLTTLLNKYVFDPLYVHANLFATAFGKSLMTQGFWEDQYRTTSSAVRSLVRNPSRLYHEIDFRRSAATV